MGSLIIIDIDDILTKAILIESVDGRYTVKGIDDTLTTV